MIDSRNSRFPLWPVWRDQLRASVERRATWHGQGARPAAAAESSAGASGGGAQGDWPPIEKLPPPWATAWEGLLPVLHIHTLLERSYSTRKTMKRTNFSRRFDKPNLNFQKVLYRMGDSDVICSICQLIFAAILQVKLS